MMSNHELLTELALRKGVQSQMDDIVHAATKAAALLQGSDMEKNQIRNALNVADESNSVPVVTNFIRYQIGRSRTGKAWQHKGFGLQVIEDLEDRQGAVAQAAARAVEVAGQELEKRGQAVPDALVQDAHRELMRYYLGYLNRAFYFGSSDVKGSWQVLQQAAQTASAG
jgi:hypothetical protein